MMKGKRYFPLGFLLAGVLTAVTLSASAAEDMQLEPCVNGEVSASGLYPSQEAENQALAAEEVANPRDIGSGDDDLISAFGGSRDDFQR